MESNRVQDQAQSFNAQHHLCGQKVAPAGSQKLVSQDPAPNKRCGIEERTGHQRRQGRNGDGNRDGGGDGDMDRDGDGDGNGDGDGDGDEDEDGNKHECRDGSENGSKRGSGTGNKYR